MELFIILIRLSVALLLTTELGRWLKAQDGVEKARGSRESRERKPTQPRRLDARRP